MLTTNMIITLIFYFTLIVIVYLLSQVISDRTPTKVALIATIAATIAQLLVSGIKQVILP